MPYVVKKNDSEYCVFKKGASSPIKGGCHKTKKDADKHRDALNINVTSMALSAAHLIADDIMGSSAIQALQDNPPQLTTRSNVEIVKTGIEYPLSTGPCTFTPEDLAQAVAAQDDPAINSPRIWLGHPDDPRIHGKRADGGPPSGEPAVGRVTNMHLTEDGHCIVGDLEGIPVWLDNILASAYPSRSIEGNFDVETVTGHKWDLVISGLALLGVCWPGVSTLEDIASMYTETGPDNVEIIEATKEKPVTIIAAADRTVVGQVTVEDLRREYYEQLTNEQTWWWIRAIYLDPNELIVCDDDSGDLYRQTFTIDGETIAFSDPKEVKVKYVNASDGSIRMDPINKDREHVALFASRAEARPGAAEPGSPDKGEIVVDLFGGNKNVITIEVKESA